MPGDHLERDVLVEILAGKNIEIGLAAVIAEMSGQVAGLDQLHQREARRLGQFMTEMLDPGSAVSLHVNGLDQISRKGGDGIAIADPVIAPGGVDNEMLTEGLGHGLSSLP